VLREGRRVVPGWHEALRLQVKWQCRRQHSPDTNQHSMKNV
jgi:hypothetical protein